MNAFIDGAALWLADFHLVATALLLGVLTALAVVKQPARRMAVTRATLGALAGLAVLCALPGWSVVHLITDRQALPNEAMGDRLAVAPVEQSVTQIIPHINIDQMPSPQPERQAISHPEIAPAFQQRSQRTSWLRVALIAHAAGSAMIVAWLMAGAVMARRIRRGAVAASAELQAALDRIAGSSGAPRLLASDEVATPVAMGVFDSTIILPSAMTDAGDADPLAPILAHELAHVRNGDLHSLALSRLLLILLWPQPLYWWFRRSLRLDQEVLADVAAAEVAGRVEYAERLVAWARNQDRGHQVPRLAGAVGLWEGPSQLKRRIALLLDEKFALMRSCSRRWRGACFAAMTLAAVGLSLVTLQPESVLARDEGGSRDAQVERKAENATETPAAPPRQVDPMALAHGFRRRDDAEPNTFKGRTVDESNKPLAGVEVTLLRGSQDFVKPRTIVGRTTTDANGDYRFSNVVDEKKEYPNGILTAANASDDPLYWIVVRKPGCISRESGRGQVELLQQGQANDFVMPPGSSLRGRVTDQDGKPVAGAIVSKSPWLSQFGIWSATTDENGEFEIDDLTPFSVSEERNRLEEQQSAVNAQLAAGAEPTLSFSMAPQFLVRHPDFAVAKLPTVDIPGRAEAVLERAAAIAGRVVDDQGRPVAEAIVIARVSRDPRRQANVGSEDFFRSTYETSARCDERGTFVIPSLFAGQFDVQVEAPELLDRGMASVDVKGGETTELGDVALDAGVPIRIKFVDAATGQAPSDAATLAAQAAVFLESQVGQRPTPPKAIRLNDEGTAEVRALPGQNIVFVHEVRDEKGVRGHPVQQATRVEVRRGEMAEVTIQLRSGANTGDAKAKPSSSSSGGLEAKDWASKTAFNSSGSWYLMRSAATDVDAGRATLGTGHVSLDLAPPLDSGVFSAISPSAGHGSVDLTLDFKRRSDADE
jgi:beta-lactamase regulating signal transducer with metallopeptidase domain/protocatechuate 3,4-dioxygenase beta subunit